MQVLDPVSPLMWPGTSFTLRLLPPHPARSRFQGRAGPSTPRARWPIGNMVHDWRVRRVLCREQVPYLKHENCRLGSCAEKCVSGFPDNGSSSGWVGASEACWRALEARANRTEF